jgi:hypothetical protein
MCALKSKYFHLHITTKSVNMKSIGIQAAYNNPDIILGI